MILTYNYQRIINLGREGPMTTPTQTKGQRSSLGLPVTSTPFSDLNAGYGPSLRTLQDENGTEETSDKRSGIRQLRGAGQRPVSARPTWAALVAFTHISSSGGESNRGGNDKQQQRRRKQPRQQQTKATEATATEAATAARINKGHLRLQSGLGLELSSSSQYRRGVSRGPKLGH